MMPSFRTLLLVTWCCSVHCWLAGPCPTRLSSVLRPRTTYQPIHHLAAFVGKGAPSAIDPSSCSFQEAIEIGEGISADLEAGGTSSGATLASLLSHPNGIRGFFVNYLTNPVLKVPESPEVPAGLQAALASSNLCLESSQVLVMNAVMPTAMVIAHKERNAPEAAEASELTARRALTVLKAAGKVNDQVISELMSAAEAASTAVLGSDLRESPKGDVKFWLSFFEKWGYGPAQIRAIADMLGDARGGN
mmetsp:Transcript_25590/g.57406  ORF Transcript_25590/g.57406 Transcript_25590/m.57406 type:complete len:248 (+) Transcript_25590:102-845(+)